MSYSALVTLATLNARYAARLFTHPQSGITHFNPSIPLSEALLQKILHFLDPQTRQSLALLSKEWYARVRGKPFVFQIVGFQGRADYFRIQYDISRNQGETILQQTG